MATLNTPVTPNQRLVIDVRKAGNNHNLSSISIERGGGMTTAAYESVEDLAFAHWQYNANEKAYANNLINKKLYEFAREELHNIIAQLSKVCYDV